LAPKSIFLSSSSFHQVKNLARQLHGLIRDILAQEDDPDLQIQRARWGQALRRPVPLGPKANTNPMPVDFFFLRANEPHEPEHTETQRFKDLVLRDFSNPQNEHVYGLAHASGSGKTRLAFALGTQEAHVVLIRLSFGDSPSPAFAVLTDFLQVIYDQLDRYCKAQGLDGRSPPETIFPHTIPLNHYAQVALDAVRIFIFAHLEWLAIVDAELSDLHGGRVDRQRRIWLQALENGVGSEGTSAIFSRRVTELLSLEVPPVTSGGVWPEQATTPAKQYCESVTNQLRSRMLGGPGGRVVIAFDEIGTARTQFPGLWYQFRHFESRQQHHRLQELSTGLPTDGYSEPADLYLAFIVLIRTLDIRYMFRSILMDTNFSLFDIEDMMRRSAMRGSLRACTSGYFHRMATPDMYAMVQRYFEVPAVIPPEVQRALAVFEGRPLYFVEHALANFLDLCAKNRPSSQNAVINCLLEATSPAAVFKAIEFFEHRVAKAWNNTRAPAVAGTPTVSTSLATLDAMLRLDVRLEESVELDEEQVRDLSATGMIFGHQKDQDNGRLTYSPRQEPLTLLAIRRFTDQKLRRPKVPLSQRDDHVWTHLLRSFNGQNRTGKGEPYEIMVAWLFAHARLNLEADCTLGRLLEEARVTPTGFAIPSRFRDLVIATAAMEDMQKEAPRLDWDSVTIQYNIDNDARPDVIIPLLTSAGERVICAIQAKSGTVSTLTDALASVTPACMYLAKNCNALQALQEQRQLPGDELANLKRDSLAAKKAGKRRLFDEAVQTSGLEQRWLRAVCRRQPYHAEELEMINRHNEAVDADPARFDFVLPLIFLQPQDALPNAHGSLDGWILRRWTIDQRNQALSALPVPRNPLNSLEITSLMQRLRATPGGISEFVSSLTPAELAEFYAVISRQQQ